MVGCNVPCCAPAQGVLQPFGSRLMSMIFDFSLIFPRVSTRRPALRMFRCSRDAYRLHGCGVANHHGSRNPQTDQLHSLERAHQCFTHTMHQALSSPAIMDQSHWREPMATSAIAVQILQVATSWTLIFQSMHAAPA